MKKLIVAGTIVTMLASAVMAGDTILDMPFNDTSGLKDLSELQNNGVVHGSAAVKDGALQLDGKKSYIICGKKDNLNLGKDDMTIIAKFKLAAEQPERSGIVTKGAGSRIDAGYAFMYRLPKKAFYLYVSNGKKRVGFQSNSDELNDGKWHTVAVTISRGVEVIFALDGRIRGTRKENSIPADNISNPTGPLLVGSWGGSHCLNGSIKDVKIIKKSFSADELKTLTK